jgi:hypothetical protein
VGWVVPVTDAGALAQTWEKVLHDNGVELQARLRRGRDRVEGQYSAAAMAQKFIDLYQGLGQRFGQPRRNALKRCSAAAHGSGHREHGQVHGHHQAAQDHGQKGHDQRLQ